PHNLENVRASCSLDARVELLYCRIRFQLRCIEHLRASVPAPQPTSRRFPAPFEVSVPSWMLRCPHCESSVEHSRIETEIYLESLLPVRPKLPLAGSQIKCPNCNEEFANKTYDLTYHRNSEGTF